MLTSGTLTPAYGRDYTSAQAFVDDLNAGKDARYVSFNGDGYVGLSDLQGRFQLRYGQLRKVASVIVANGRAKVAR